MREVLSSIFYVSRSLVSVSQVDRIVSVSRRNNRARGITGGMLFSGRFFAQILEGETSTITTAMRTMALDPRHDRITVIWARPELERQYRLWTMGFIEAPAADQMIEPLIRGAAGPNDAERLGTYLRRLIGETSEPFAN